MTTHRSPWPALWALVLGFFMILVDTTIVSIANPTIQSDLGATTTQVIWVTSAYLLSYAVPLLITGRLGDRFGPRRVYLIGLSTFTLASLACGLAETLPGSPIANLIAARAVQGLGAAMMTPQTMAVITRTFPAHRRGPAMALWGAVAGIATLVGPLLGGVLVDSLGWEWIFIVNVPVGIVAFVLAWRLVPSLETHSHQFDWWGVVLSAVGMFLLVFAVQEGQTYAWAPWIWVMIATGLAVLAVFVWWQRRNTGEPLVPLGLFKERNFAVASTAISAVGFATTAMFIPLVYFYQVALGMTPTESALMSVPTAVASIALAPLAGKLTDRVHPRYLVVPAMSINALATLSYLWLMTPQTPLVVLLIPPLMIGIASSFMWGPLSSTATRGLPTSAAGAGAGVYNTTRQVGAVMGSAAIATVMVSRVSAELSEFGNGAPTVGGEAVAGSLTQGPLPDAVLESFSTAMAQTLVLPALVMAAGAVLAWQFVMPRQLLPRTAAVEGDERVAPGA
ncbi:DHA2 family efflux MFS transporter permease subunit [Demequina globuliformis]|uniref:DHA2 family efflux MFS transporter permease subunit n=1 Tax=Demequina globuliformis TaxID=676202 RepID=UPI0022A8FCAF|nr:DHA2 family efflux MFS transporter permease subunit [Demequina globuliformis]